MLAMCRELGFAVEADPEEPGVERVKKVLNPRS
jgi:hypothetical protein